MILRIILATALSFAIRDIDAQATKLKLLGHWRDPNLKGSAQYDNTFNEAYGFTVNGHEYGIIGSTYGWHIIDITDPANLFERMRVKGGASSTNVIHRDFRYYKCHIYAVCDEGTSTLQILDVSNLPDTAFLVYDSNELFIRSHNFYIDEKNAKMYTCAEKGNSGYFALGLYDLSNPTNPTFIGHYGTFGDIVADHVHDCYVRDNIAYLNCGNNGFAIVDFTNNTNPKTLFTLKPTDYKYSGYNHSGWLSPNGKTYVMADENHGSPLKVFDMSDISKAKIISYLSVYGDSTKAIPHNPLVSCDYTYVAYYYDGLQVYDIRNPKEPKLTHYYPTSTEQNFLNYKGAWGTFPFMPSGHVIVADMQNGMFVVEGPEKVCNPQNVCNTTGLDPIKSEDEILVFPNPSSSDLMITAIPGIKNIWILNTKGSLVYSKTVNSLSELNIETSEWLSGMYLIKAGLNNGNHKVIKWIKE